MCADLSHLGGLQDVDTLELDNTYPATSEKTFRLPSEGRYTLQAPDTFPPAAFTRSKSGALSVSIDPTIVGPVNEGFTIRYTKVSAKPFQRNGKVVSQVGDYLKGVGFQGVIKNEQQIADAVEATAGSIYEADLVWLARNNKTGFELKGMTRFPKLSDGEYQSWVLDPTTGDKVRAYLNIDRIIPKS